MPGRGLARRCTAWRVESGVGARPREAGRSRAQLRARVAGGPGAVRGGGARVYWAP